MIAWLHLLRRNLSYLLLMKTLSLISKSRPVELICNVYLLVYIWFKDMVSIMD
jgi:hypothetical protein